jgi:hypothetical protein
VRGAWAVVHEYHGGDWSGTYAIEVAVPKDSGGP